MAIISPHPDSEIRSLHVAVYYKRAWADEWIYAPEIQPLNASHVASPGISSAAFETHYGSGFWEQGDSMDDASQMSSFCYAYVQIRIRRAETETVIWTGIVPTEQFKILGQSGGNKTADHIIQAYGLEILLMTRLDGAWVKNIGEDDEQWIDHVPAFNRQHEYSSNIIGNRSFARELEALTYIFAGESEGTEQWSNYDIAEYLLEYYQYENGPSFYIKASDEIKEALNNIIDVYDFNGMTVLDALNILINRNRGLGWHLVVSPGGSYVDLVPFSLLAYNIQLGDMVMPGNKNIVPVDLWTESEHVDVLVKSDVSKVYDRILVQGARMKSCCTIDFDSGSLEKAWAQAEEAAYKDAAKDKSGYGDLDNTGKGIINDIFRDEDRFQRVFAAFRIPRDWDWKINNTKVNPALDSSGLLNPNEQAAYWNAGKRISNILPFKVGYDYSSYLPVNNNLANAEPEQRHMFVLVNTDDGYQYADKLKPVGAMVRPLVREMSLLMRFNPPYLAAKNHFDPDSDEPAMWSFEIDEKGIDYETMKATVFLETDQLVKVEHVFNHYENQRTLTITLPDAELWYVVPGTVIGVDENGELIEFGCGDNFLRDDRTRMEQALNAAIAFYGVEKNKVQITMRELDPGIPVGTLIDKIDVTDVGAHGSVVTAMQWDFQSSPAASKIITDFAELDFSTIFRR